MRGRRRTAAVAAVLAAVLAVGSAAVVRADAPVFSYPEWRDRVRTAGLEPEEVIYPFTASPEMVAWAEAVTAGPLAGGPLTKLQRLQLAMFDPDRLGFTYDERLTLTAREAFAAGTGNCLSFTSLFIALSRGIGIPTFLVSVRREPEVGRDQDLVVINRHVVAGYRHGPQLNLFDFYLFDAAAPASHSAVDDVRASAMFHTNRGGSALRDGRPADALPQLEIATTLSPDWSPGWVNLGVARSRLVDPGGALAAYQKALEVDPGNPSAFTNLSVLYREMGLEAEARVALLAAGRTTDNPFTLVTLADAAIADGDLSQAANLLKRAKRRYPVEPEVYESLARLAIREGELARAERHLRKAAGLRSQRAATSD
jgi:Flp pilus assembly protein TadD